jgi:TM2 domain-containing membrane protein YozV
MRAVETEAGMRGQVLGVDKRTGEGIVSGDDGRRYAFGPDDWAHRGAPAIGALVDFEAQESRALSLFPVPAAPPAGGGQPLAAYSEPPVPKTDRNKLVAALIAFFIGPLGIHRFYLGRTGTGILMLVLSITVVGLMLTIPWALIDMVRYLVMSDDEFASRYPRRR